MATGIKTFCYEATSTRHNYQNRETQKNSTRLKKEWRQLQQKQDQSGTSRYLPLEGEGEIFVGGSHGFQGKRTRDQSSTTEYEGRTKKIDGQ